MSHCGKWAGHVSDNDYAVVVYYVKIVPVRNIQRQNRMNIAYLKAPKFTQEARNNTDPWQWPFPGGTVRLVLSRGECPCRFAELRQ